MARNGSGTFVRAHDFTDDAAAAIKIRADRMDEEIDGIATALSASIANDGQTTILADLPMSTFKHTGVGNATARNQYATVASLQDGSHNWVAAGGTADAITATYAPALTALVDGQLCFVRAGAANATTTPTFAPNGLTAHTMTRNGGVALAPGDIAGAGHELILRYKLASTIWELLNPKGPLLSTRQNLTSGSGATYTRPAGVRQLRIRMVGGGGGSGGTGAGFGNGGTGGSTIFNSINAAGGGGSAGGDTGNNAISGAGGTGGSGSASFRAPGSAGCSGQAAGTNGGFGGSGGASPLGGGAKGGSGAIAAAANTGGGASGTNCGTTNLATGGGGAGEYVELIINSPSATYTYTIGAAGAAGAGATGGAAGGTGLIIVDEIY